MAAAVATMETLLCSMLNSETSQNRPSAANVESQIRTAIALGEDELTRSFAAWLQLKRTGKDENALLTAKSFLQSDANLADDGKAAAQAAEALLELKSAASSPARSTARHKCGTGSVKTVRWQDQEHWNKPGKAVHPELALSAAVRVVQPQQKDRQLEAQAGKVTDAATSAVVKPSKKMIDLSGEEDEVIDLSAAQQTIDLTTSREDPDQLKEYNHGSLTLLHKTHFRESEEVGAVWVNQGRNECALFSVLYSLVHISQVGSAVKWKSSTMALLPPEYESLAVSNKFLPLPVKRATRFETSSTSESLVKFVGEDPLWAAKCGAMTIMLADLFWLRPDAVLAAANGNIYVHILSHLFALSNQVKLPDHDGWKTVPSLRSHKKARYSDLPVFQPPTAPAIDLASDEEDDLQSAKKQPTAEETIDLGKRASWETYGRPENFAASDRVVSISISPILLQACPTVHLDHIKPNCPFITIASVMRAYEPKSTAASPAGLCAILGMEICFPPAASESATQVMPSSTLTFRGQHYHLAAVVLRHPNRNRDLKKRTFQAFAVEGDTDESIVQLISESRRIECAYYVATKYSWHYSIAKYLNSPTASSTGSASKSPTIVNPPGRIATTFRGAMELAGSVRESKPVTETSTVVQLVDNHPATFTDPLWLLELLLKGQHCMSIQINTLCKKHLQMTNPPQRNRVEYLEHTFGQISLLCCVDKATAINEPVHEIYKDAVRSLQLYLSARNRQCAVDGCTNLAHSVLNQPDVFAFVRKVAPPRETRFGQYPQFTIVNSFSSDLGVEGDHNKTAQFFVLHAVIVYLSQYHFVALLRVPETSKTARTTRYSDALSGPGYYFVDPLSATSAKKLTSDPDWDRLPRHVRDFYSKYMIAALYKRVSDSAQGSFQIDRVVSIDPPRVIFVGFNEVEDVVDNADFRRSAAYDNYMKANAGRTDDRVSSSTADDNSPSRRKKRTRKETEL